ncbi:transcription initiation factor IIA, gamma subunit [Tuber magnatum]|uniref:Transcription initiation factor IIA subunit 2 n=1 Tax=Tuber magnatum TaxID=42249 RepID=A0A317SB74_9PEZI|nr:transcription initiation factor IIA, gamma subunit [Tuber magnatum]
MSNQNYYELYRRSCIGVSLMDALDDMISRGRMTPQLAMKILSNFDRGIAEVLASRVKATLSFKGHLDTYRFCDDVWTFLVTDVTFKFPQKDKPSISTKKVKIVSCNSKKPGEQ